VADAIITSGGVSVGEADFVKDTLNALGEVHFWKIAMKPGRPLAFGRVGGALFFGLPGNPVSVMVTFYEFVQPALRRLMGEREPALITVPAKSAGRLKKRPGRVEYQRGILGRDENGGLVVSSTGEQGSGILSSVARANCFIVLSSESAGVEPGSVVQVQPFEGMV
jgi:molybdopterin molybdotransferase